MKADRAVARVLAYCTTGLPPLLVPVARVRLKAFVLRHRVRLGPVRFPRWFSPEYVGELTPNDPFKVRDLDFRVLDHVHTWTRDGRQVLMTCQPYDVEPTEHEAIRRAFAGLGLVADCDRSASWWYPGETTLVTVRLCARRPATVRSATSAARGIRPETDTPGGPS